MDNQKILIVDDDDFLIEMYSVKFKESGFDVALAKNGEEALKKTAEIKPAVILLDVVMPKMDGFEVLDSIKKQNISPRSAVVMLTNLGQKEDIEKGFRLGAADYIIKAQFTPSEVVSKIKDLILKNGLQ